jgi:DNA-binding XRE family transcriptional regulator
MKGALAVTVKIVVTPGGEKLAILPAADYEDMRDALTHQRAMADYQAARIAALTFEETRALLAAPTPLAFWRAKRGLTQAKLAKAAGTTQPHVADLEAGKHGGSLDVMARIARALAVPVDSLIASD